MEKEQRAPLVMIADDGELRSSTEVIAIGMDYDHASVIKLTRRYEGELEQFGPLRFEIRKGAALQHGGFAKATEYAELNEQQAALLISLMRNKPEVVGFKVDLVREFFRMRNALQRRDTSLWEQRLELERRDARSFEVASWGGRAMANRRSALPGITAERARIHTEMQQPIPGIAPAPSLTVVGRGRAAANDSKKRKA